MQYYPKMQFYAAQLQNKNSSQQPTDTEYVNSLRKYVMLLQICRIVDCNALGFISQQTYDKNLIIVKLFCTLREKFESAMLSCHK